MAVDQERMGMLVSHVGAPRACEVRMVGWKLIVDVVKLLRIGGRPKSEGGDDGGRCDGR